MGKTNVEITNVTGDDDIIQISFVLKDKNNEIIKTWKNVGLDRSIMDTNEKIIRWCQVQAKTVQEHYDNKKKNKVQKISDLSNQLKGSYEV